MGSKYNHIDSLKVLWLYNMHGNKQPPQRIMKKQYKKFKQTRFYMANYSL